MSIASEITRIRNNIAAAYTACGDKGATMPQTQNSANLADTISSISQGGVTEVEPKYVNFIDTDGTILYSYTEAEVQAMTTLPSLPTKTGYTYQSWNWTLADIQAYGFPLTVGAVRIPADGKTHLMFELLKNDNLTLSIPFSESTGREVTIDWGDGSSETYTASPAVHTYAASGTYVVLIDANDYFKMQRLLSSTAISLVKADLGARFIMNDMSFNSCYGLKEISIPQNVTYIYSTAFQYCCSLKSITLPSPLGEIGVGAFNICYTLQSASLPKTISIVSSGIFSGCPALKMFSVPLSGERKIENSCFRNCKSVQSVYIPSGLSVIDQNAFTDCENLRYIDLSALTAVPTLNHINAFFYINSNAVFYVRNAAMLSAFQAATNWSNYASKMQIGGKYGQI